MKLLLKRMQTFPRARRVHFKLWARIELDHEENELFNRYRMKEAVVIEADETGLIRTAAMIGIGVFFVVGPIVFTMASIGASVFFGLGAGAAAGYFYFDHFREQVHMNDLLRGKTFTCKNVIELAQKEAWISTVTSFIRQVLESAKHWDGMEHLEIEALPKAEAKLLILKSL